MVLIVLPLPAFLFLEENFRRSSSVWPAFFWLWPIDFLIGSFLILIRLKTPFARMLIGLFLLGLFSIFIYFTNVYLEVTA